MRTLTFILSNLPPEPSSTQGAVTIMLKVVGIPTPCNANLTPFPMAPRTQEGANRTIESSSRSNEAFGQPFPNDGPFRFQYGKNDRIAHPTGMYDGVLTEDSFPDSAEFSNCRLRTQVDRIDVERNSSHSPRLEGIREHEEFGFRVDGRTPDGGGIPSMPDFHAAMGGHGIQKTRAADDGLIRDSNHGE